MLEMFPIIIGTLLFTIIVAFLVAFVVLYRKSQYKFELERQEFKQAQLETEIEIREQTLTNISRDLHDHFGQMASLIKMNTSMLQGKDQQELESIGETKELIQQLIDDIRSLSVSLNSENLEKLGLATMIDRDLERIRRSAQMVVISELAESRLSIENTTKIFLYRMFQEMVNNVIKHAEASELSVGLEANDRRIHLWVADNGKGIPAQPKQGSGLTNLTKRAEMIGARVRIDNSAGTRIDVKLSLENLTRE